MTPRPSIISPLWKKSIAEAVTKRLAKWAGYKAAEPSRTRVSHGRYASNPNSTSAQIQRISMQWGAEFLSRNSEFAIAYLRTRRNYCSAQLTYTPDTGDDKLDTDVSAYLDECLKRGGCNRSAQEEFAMAFDAEMPVRGDAALLWDRRADGSLFLTTIRADQIGYIYQYTPPMVTASGLTYFAGMYFSGRERVGYKIYQLGYNETYSNPENYDAMDVIYGQDDLMPGVRGVTAFHGAIIILEKSDALFQSAMDSARRQAKTAVAVFNEQGMPDEYSYDTETSLNGDVIYAERNADGAVVEYKFKGDSMMNVSATAPGDEAIQGVKLGERRAARAMGFPYSFLVDSNEIGGAPVRLEIGQAGKEISRIHNLHRPKLNIIKDVFLLDAINKGVLPAKATLMRGSWHFPTLPTADAFRESRDDIASNRAGLDTRENIVAKTLGQTFTQVLRSNQKEAVMIAKAVEDANDELAVAGYARTVTAADIAQVSDNPAQAAQGEAIVAGKDPNAPPAKATLRAYVRDSLGRFAPEPFDEREAETILADADEYLNHAMDRRSDTDHLEELISIAEESAEWRKKWDAHHKAARQQGLPTKPDFLLKVARQRDRETNALAEIKEIIGAKKRAEVGVRYPATKSRAVFSENGTH